MLCDRRQLFFMILLKTQIPLLMNWNLDMGKKCETLWVKLLMTKGYQNWSGKDFRFFMQKLAGWLWCGCQLHHITWLFLTSWLYLSEKDYKLPVPLPNLEGQVNYCSNLIHCQDAGTYLAAFSWQHANITTNSKVEILFTTHCLIILCFFLY